jgi:integrase
MCVYGLVAVSYEESAELGLAGLRVARVGAFVETGDLWEPFRLVDPVGVVVVPVAEYLKDLQAAGKSVATQRSYGRAVLRWLRFLWAIEVPWDQATRSEGRDFSRWIRLVDKAGGGRGGAARYGGFAAAPAVRPNAVTGKAAPGRKYAPSTIGHSETVLRGFYSFHQEAGTGPMVNPFPLARGRAGGRVNAHHDPVREFGNERSGLYRPRLARRRPRSIPDEYFNELFAQLGSHRDRALMAFWISTGVRAAELLGVRCGDADPGMQLITVVRKGTLALQQVPASPDAFVWLRLYQAQMYGLVPARADDPLWWTLRRPFRQLAYHAAHRMFERVNAKVGANWTLHDLRHSAAYRMAQDPLMPITDVQWVLGHASLTTTQLYTTPYVEDVIASVLAHQARAASGRQDLAPVTADAMPQYRAESLNVLFGEGPA